MIETRLLSDSPEIVHHRVSGRLSEADALAGVNEAIVIIERLIKTQSAFSLLLDMRGYIFGDLASHKIWSQGFKEHELIKKHVKMVAVVADSSLSIKAEKDLLETSTLRFFFEPGAAKDWLRTA